MPWLMKLPEESKSAYVFSLSGHKADKVPKKSHYGRYTVYSLSGLVSLSIRTTDSFVEICIRSFFSKALVR